MLRGACVAIVSGLVIGSILLIAPPAQALHWCSPLSVQVSPLSGGTGEVVTISVTVTNGIAETLTIDSIVVRFSWTSTGYNFGSAVLTGSGASTTKFGSIQLPSNAGDYQVAITVTGQTPSDFFSEPCTASGIFRVSASLLPYFVVGGIVAVVAIVAVIILYRRRPSSVLPPQTAQSPPPSPFCPVCGQQLAWVAPSNRWYCSQCGQFR